MTDEDREVFKHSVMLWYGAMKQRPQGHERCVLCDLWFGKHDPDTDVKKETSR